MTATEPWKRLFKVRRGRWASYFHILHFMSSCLLPVKHTSAIIITTLLTKKAHGIRFDNKMSVQIRISAKNLGELALPNFCPRCFWLKLRLNNKLPYQIFPGIFSSIDSYTKNIIQSFVDINGKFPNWLNGLGDLVSYRKPPHYSKFYIVDDESNILLNGTPDGVFVKGDDSYLIADYKTAKYTGKQDELMPMYEVQLNSYALIGEECGFQPVSGLALIYMEPVTHVDAVIDSINHRDDGFAMGFSAYIHQIELDSGRIIKLLAKVRGYL